MSDHTQGRGHGKPGILCVLLSRETRGVDLAAVEEGGGAEAATAAASRVGS